MVRAMRGFPVLVQTCSFSELCDQENQSLVELISDRIHCWASQINGTLTILNFLSQRQQIPIQL